MTSAAARTRASWWMSVAVVGLSACNAILDLPDPTLDESIGRPTGAAGSGSGGDITSASAGGNTGTGGDGASAAGGGPTVAVLLHNARVRKIELDDASIFWVEDLDARIGRMAKDGTDKVILAQGTIKTGFFPSGLALDETDVYWTSFSDGIRKCAKAGCGNAPTVLLDEADGYSPGGIEVDGELVWFAHYVDDTNCSLHKMPKAGGTVTEVLDQTEFCPGSCYNRIDLVGGDLYFTCESGLIGRMDTATETVEVLTGDTPPATPGAFVVSGATLYYTQFLDQGSVFALSTSGYLDGFETIALGQANTNGITADTQFLYWLNVGGPIPDNGSGSLVRCSITDCNGTVEVIEPYQDIPQVPVNDDDHVYWANWGNGFTANSGIWKKPK